MKKGQREWKNALKGSRDAHWWALNETLNSHFSVGWIDKQQRTSYRESVKKKDFEGVGKIFFPLFVCTSRFRLHIIELAPHCCCRPEKEKRFRWWREWRLNCLQMVYFFRGILVGNLMEGWVFRLEIKERKFKRILINFVKLIKLLL